MRIFITGNRGQLGRQLTRALSAHTVDGGDLPDFDVTDADTARRRIEAARPHVIIHSAALTDTRLCEDDPDLARRVNGLGTRNVALACRDAGAALLYVSTNEVFDGLKGEPYVESDAPNPVNAYGRSKLEGEEKARALVERLYVVRTAWLYGSGSRDFPSKILAAASRQSELTVVTDEIATPTHARDLSDAIARLVEVGVYGVYHFTNSGKCSRYDWACEVLRLAGRSDVVMKQTTLAEYNPYPPKPPYTVLSNESGARLGITLRTWQIALAEHFAPPT
jgi:dTDP-4-dehydrorhamnose reductase